MIATIPQGYFDLVERPTIMMLGIVTPNGTPRVIPLWFNYQNGYLYFNSGPETMKHRSLLANPAVSVMILDPDNPFRYLSIQGKVIEITEVGAREHNNSLAKRYMGLDEFPGPKDKIRTVYTIAPEKIAVRGKPIVISGF